ncbi:hypothetical protein RRG08_002387 [Elysia crispata]|uniref:Uncharacterized protein n=1 Tax=Elysia crispata TaxID=231223 RepID=A0AAE1DG27_9GAST|nr:hypothetical protein RRG08_002387 [Elysia crispata]
MTPTTHRHHSQASASSPWSCRSDWIIPSPTLVLTCSPPLITPARPTSLPPWINFDPVTGPIVLPTRPLPVARSDGDTSVTQWLQHCLCYPGLTARGSTECVSFGMVDPVERAYGTLRQGSTIIKTICWYTSLLATLTRLGCFVKALLLHICLLCLELKLKDFNARLAQCYYKVMLIINTGTRIDTINIVANLICGLHALEMPQLVRSPRSMTRCHPGIPLFNCHHVRTGEDVSASLICTRSECKTRLAVFGQG